MFMSLLALFGLGEPEAPKEPLKMEQVFDIGTVEESAAPVEASPEEDDYDRGIYSDDSLWDEPGSELIRSYEKLKLKGYYATEHEKEKGIVTVGWGNTGIVDPGQEIDENQARDLFSAELNKIDTYIDSAVKYKLNPAQRGAIRSLIYNVGRGAFGKSNALKALNRGDLEEFKKQAFSKEVGFVFQNKERLNGLVKRRAAEQELFDSMNEAPKPQVNPNVVTLED